MVTERWPAGELEGAEATGVAFGEAHRSVPDEGGRVFEGFETAGADVGLVGAFGFVFAPFAGVFRDAVVEEEVFRGEGWSAFGEAAVKLVWGWFWGLF